MNSCGWCITDQYSNCLLFNPTYFEFFEEDEEVVIPFVYDSGRFTVFRNEEMLEELYAVWGETITNMKYLAVPLVDIVGEMMSKQEEIDNQD